MEKNIRTVQDKYQKGKFFNSAEELKSFIALNIFGLNTAEFYLLKRSSLFTLLKDIGSLTVSSNLFGMH